MSIDRFNIRVYGLLLNEKQEVLLAHEKIGDFQFTKFPGGGLEFGEGINDCLVREFKEETGIDVMVKNHLYTTDFFQQSAFKKTDQLISVYYLVAPMQDTSLISLEEQEVQNGNRTEYLRFFWVPVHELHESMVTFPVDQYIIRNFRDNLLK